MRPRSWSAVLIGAGLGMALMAPAAGAAGTYMVSSSADSGPGSLREVVREANARPEITLLRFTPDVRGEINLTSGSIEVTRDFTITGPGRGELRISGNDASRIFVVAKSASLEITDLTLTHGLATGQRVHASRQRAGDAFGGAILNHGDLRLSDVAITDSVALGGRSDTGPGGGAYGGAIDSDGRLTVVDSSITGNRALGNGDHDEMAPGNDGGAAAGGAIRNEGTLTIVRSEIDNNQAVGADGQYAFIPPFGPSQTGYGGDARGGAIFATGQGETSITDSTLAGNVAHAGRGGPLGDAGNRPGVPGNAAGGAVFAGGPRFSLTQSTVTANGVEVASVWPPTVAAPVASGAGLALRSPSGALETDTVAGNGGAASIDVAPSGTSVSVRNTIVESCAGGRLVSGGFNIDYGTSCGFAEATDKSSTDARLGPLGSHGGPTRTRPIGFDSPAVDQGASRLDHDQRGEHRPIDFPAIPAAPGGNSADIGAFELQIASPIDTDPSPLAFDDQRVETISRPRELTVRNVGTDPFRISSVKIVGGDEDDFQISSESCTTAGPIAAKDTCRVRVRFLPSETGARRTRMLIVASVAGDVAPIVVTGKGVPAPAKESSGKDEGSSGKGDASPVRDQG